MPKEQEKRVSLSAEEGKHQRLPGMWQAAMIAGLSALVVGYCVQRNAGSFNPPAEGSVSRVAEVGPEDLAGAITTLDISSSDGAQFRERKDCVHRLAWVTIALAPGQPAGQIRLQSGNYLSPAFALTNTPIRVALPYPAPYTVGHGTLSIFGTTADATVALTPPWHVLANDRWHAREVTWMPAAACPEAGQ